MTTPPPAVVVLRIPTITLGYFPGSSLPQPCLQPILQFKDSDSPSHNQRHRAWKEWLEGQRRKEEVRARSQPVSQPQLQPFHPYDS